MTAGDVTGPDGGRSFGQLSLFSSPPGAPRTRRTIDWFTLSASLLVYLLAGWAARSGLSLDARVLIAFADLPGWLEFLARGVFTTCGVIAFGLLTAVVVQGRGRRIVRDLFVAIGLLCLIVLASARLTVGQWPDVLPEFIDPGSPSFPNLRIALLTVLVTTPAPHVIEPARKLGRWLIAASGLAGIVLGVTTVTGVIGAIALGVGLSALAHLVFGSPAGLPSIARLEEALDDLGITDTSVALLEEQPVGVALASGMRPDGASYVIKVYGRDAADAQLASKLWRSLWYRDSGPAPSLTGMQQVEHEALTALLAERAGAPVEHVVVAGRDLDHNAFLVVDRPEQPSLATLGRLTGDDDADAAWASLRSLHRAGAVHGSIRPDVVLTGDREAVLVDLSRSSLSLGQGRTQTDVVSMLATLTCAIGAERAVASAIRCLDVDDIERALPYLQDAVLAPDLRKALRRESSVGELLEMLTDELGLDAPELVEVRRVRPVDVVMALFGVAAAFAIVSQIAEIGIEQLLEEVRNADAGWLVTAFFVALAGYYWDVVSLRGALEQPIPTVPTLFLQSAKRFIGLVVPTTAARVVTDVRYLQKLGVPSAVAVAQGPLIGLIGFVAEVTLLLLSLWTVGHTVETDSLGDGRVGWILGVVAAVVVVSAVIIAAVPRLRQRVVPWLHLGLTSVRAVVREPRRLGQIYIGQILERLTGALALAATLAAFGQTLPFGAVVFVSVGTGLLAGLAPVPGGIGVAEATMTALLTSVGVPSDVAVSTAIVYRMITSYLPPALGWFALRWLTNNGFL